MYSHGLHQHINREILEAGMDIAGNDNAFFTRFMANASVIFDLYMGLYEHHPRAEAIFHELIQTLIHAHQNRPAAFRQRDQDKLSKGHWHLSNELLGMSLYVDRFCGTLKQLPEHLDYLQNLGVNLLHLMPLFESPAHASDGGYAVSDFRRIDSRFGSLDDLKTLQSNLTGRNMYLMLDIVLNHTSDQHDWAQRARAGDSGYQDYYYFYRDRSLPDQYEKSMPEIFPESAPGNFSFIPECGKWVMTVFHQYQWDLNYTNPRVLLEMLDTILFYANLGVDILRIDAPAFIWKQLGTSCQNLPQAHQLIRLIRHCVQVSTPGMALLGEAIVAPSEIMQYFGTGKFAGRECDFAYNATHMALQWDMLATGDTRVMLAAQEELLQKPFGTSWITYTRCHDDIGLGFDDKAIRQAGYEPFAHRDFLKRYYTGTYPGSPARGALFSSNPRTGDARISGSLASLCGLESALESGIEEAVEIAIQKILLMQAHSFFLGGLPMLYYGDEVGYINDYSYRDDPNRNYDNRWMHRPMIDWEKNRRANVANSIEKKIYDSMARLAAIRRSLPMLADYSNIQWLTGVSQHVAVFCRKLEGKSFYGLFNFHAVTEFIDRNVLSEQGSRQSRLLDHWTRKEWATEMAWQLPAYGFALITDLEE